jgi:hypothetical protein
MAPCYTLTQTSIAPHSLKLPTKAQPGSTLVVPWPHHFKVIGLDGQPLTRFKESYGLGVIRKHKQKFSVLSGVRFKLNSRLRFWQHPQEDVFHHPLHIGDQSKDRIAKLRLPAQVLERLEKSNQDVREQEALALRNLLMRSAGQLSSQCWQRPLSSPVVSKFGSPRSLPSGHIYRHTGLDLRSPVGTPIQATASGLVHFTGEMTIPGQFVIVDHGDGVFSQYMHMSAIHVEKGQSVLKGDVIGLSGASGRVEAPHLHWEVVWRGTRADPLRFLAALEPLCDRE